MQFFYYARKQKVIIGVGIALALLGGVILGTWNSPEESISKTSAVAHYEKVVALTFDDGPGYKTTMQLLDGLKERDVLVTFFLVGEKIEQRKEVVERMKEDGHLIGNHTYSHIQLDNVNPDCALEEVKKTNQLIQSITGDVPGFIRPPYGAWNENLEKQIAMTPVLWTVDPFDWNVKDVNQIVKNVVSEVKSGDIILMHDIYETSVVAALEIVDQLQDQGYLFVTVDELLIE